MSEYKRTYKCEKCGWLFRGTSDQAPYFCQAWDDRSDLRPFDEKNHLPGRMVLQEEALDEEALGIGDS